MNQILLGPLLGNNRTQLIERCARLVADGKQNSFLYLAASHPLLEVATQQILDGATNRGVWGELPVYLFRGFVRRIINTAVDDEDNLLPPRIPIDREELPLKRSLVSQILAHLLATGKLKAIEPLARREGCVNTITTLLGELQRAAKSPTEISEIVASRTADLQSVDAVSNSQIDFDNEVALIYSIYSDLLQKHQLTEDDADQLRALSVLRGRTDDGREVHLPWLDDVELLVLDGFFDFTPVQGEILRQLIPRVGETLVNLNHDLRNPEIFAPFRETVSQLSGIAPFATEQTDERGETNELLSTLRERLFNPTSASSETVGAENELNQSAIQYYECGDRETEIRAIAREIKRLVLLENYELADIALVVRQRATYAQTIARIFREESVPCSLEFRVDSTSVPASRAVLKLIELLEAPQSGDTRVSRISDFADLIKSEYFRLSDEELVSLSAAFDDKYKELLNDEDHKVDSAAAARKKAKYRIGFWDADALENAFAYVGSDLPLRAWLGRAEKLVRDLPGATATRELLNLDAGAHERDTDIADQVENAETVPLENNAGEKKRRPSRDIHPAALAWTSLVIQRFTELIAAVPRDGSPVELRRAIMRLLDQFGFRDQISRPTRSATDDAELPTVMLNFNALESLRRALLAATKSLEMSGSLVQGVVGPTHGSLATEDSEETDDVARTNVALATFLAEVRRALGSQSQILANANRGGLRVLEVTDVRGLRFRAIFIAGLIEGGFPLRVSRDWIYPHEERERLKKYGLTLEDISPATLLKEEHYFYQAACRATDRLYLTRPLVIDDDAETVASYYIDELARAIAPYKIEVKTIRRDYDGRKLEEVSSPAELAVALIRQQERHRHRRSGETLVSQPRLKRLLTLARNDRLLSDSALRRIEIERERSGRMFGPYDGAITNPQLLQLLRQKFGFDFVHSASGLSKFGNCPYSFFAQRVLKLEPRGEAALDLQAIDAGKLLHDVLRRFFERHRREALYKLDRQELKSELLSIADDVFDEHERVVPPLNRQIWKIDREIRKILLEQVLWYELGVQEMTAASDVLPAYFEVSFGGSGSGARDPGSVPTPLELTRKTFVGEETIRIGGQIDRVDVAADNTLIAYDYKLSQGATREDIESGRSLQIPIYLEALERVILPGHEVAGGGYYTIRGGDDRRNKGLHRASKRDYYQLTARVGAVIDDEEWKTIRENIIAKIWEFIDAMREGKFYVNPAEHKKTCRFCDFGAVCRYSRERIDNKS